MWIVITGVIRDIKFNIFLGFRGISCSLCSDSSRMSRSTPVDSGTFLVQASYTDSSLYIEPSTPMRDCVRPSVGSKVG